ncbi:MAG: YcgL domain-containing protein [Bacteroidia bacterium]
MQLCTIYKSSKKSETYLYVEKTDDLGEIINKIESERVGLF